MSPRLDPMITRLTLMTPSLPKLGKSTLSLPMIARLPRTSFKKILTVERSALQTHAKHPHSSLSKRKMAAFVPAKTTATWTNILSQTPTLFLLSQILSTNSRTPNYLPSLMSNGATTTSASKMAINGRQPLSPTKAYLNPPSCSSGLPTVGVFQILHIW